MMHSQCKRNKITTPFGKEAYDAIEVEGNIVLIQRGPIKYDKPYEVAESGCSWTSHDQTVAIILVGNNNIIEPKCPTMDCCPSHCQVAVPQVLSKSYDCQSLSFNL